jgi:hypothetical protein
MRDAPGMMEIAGVVGVISKHSLGTVKGYLTGPPTLRLPIRFGIGIGIGIGIRDPTLTMTIGQLRKIMAYSINDLSLVLV